MYNSVAARSNAMSQREFVFSGLIRSQQKGVIQTLGCDVVLDGVRNSRYVYVICHPTPLNSRMTGSSGGHECWFSTYLNGHAVSCAGSVVLTQTHPAAPYVCRTGNITLRCQYDDVEECQVWCMMVCGLAV